MTLDKAIKYCLEVAEHNEALIKRGYAGGCNSHDCSERAENHRQLAKWLTELKEAKRLLKAAVEDMGEENFCAKVCKRDNFACRVSDTCDFKWRYADEALALLGKDTNVGHKSGGWISCKDRMPEVNEPVLFIFNTESGFKAVMYGWHETIKGLGSGWHQAGVGGARADEEVTHWQPLPEPPKE